MKKSHAIINLKKAKKIWEDMSKELELEYEIKVEDDSVIWTFDTSLKAFDDNIMAYFRIFESGAAMFTFTFDRLVIDEQTLRMVNDLNENNYFFRAYIDSEDGYLRLEHVALFVEQDDLAGYTNAILERFVDDKLKELLTPLCILTEGDPD